jgi:hypothetical protein
LEVTRECADDRSDTCISEHSYNREALLVEVLRRAHFAPSARMIEVVRKAQGDFKRLEAIVLEALPLDSERTKE